ncbi:lipocalin / cytosolic fatty-acid binding protein family domain-containing protein [Phthorimaea operculella]|nr:lipocalin / cytosolic fatty-acid binding protein family domain-containing protein [Phthorimaea operculella]
MNTLFTIVLGSLGFFCVTSAQILQDGQCDPNIGLQSNFNVDQFVGSWYEIRRSEDGGECSDWDITRTDTTNVAFSYNSVVAGITENRNIQGTYEVGTAKFTLNNYGGNGTNADFWILGINYLNYAIVYRCENVGTTQRNLFITLLGKEKVLNNIFTNQVNNILGSLGVTLNDVKEVDHSEGACDALPFIPPGQPIIIPGQCDNNISLLSSFNPADFVGTWFQIYSYPSESSVGACNTAQYSLGDGVVDVVNSEVVNQTLRVISGTASVLPNATGMLLVELEILPGVQATQNLWIIDTDYSNYAISYSCENINNDTKRVFSWIVSRSPQLSNTTRAAIDQVVNSVKDLNFAYYVESDQSPEACFYYPEPSPDTVVEFRGPCDLSIPAVANFNPVAYMGLWHDIQAYPSSFQGGQCNNAFYTLVDGVVDVFNTQVINQTLDTINGEAVIASNDGSAKLDVTFPVEGTNFTITTSYWVLATDYSSYSLVYTCSYNSQTDRKQIFSWKLSRTKSLTLQANAAMDAVIANVQVLDQRYYLQKDQSTEACFYFPEPVQGLPVRFPGVCNENISAVPNFQLSQFIGSWYEIETYPKEESGECVLHQYSASGNNALSIVSNFVQDQFRYTSNSNLTSATNDGSGKFNIRINVGNGEVEIPFWILATDYNNYALAYSCMEVVNDTYGAKAVYAWKLSRNQQGLNAAANTAINTTMANVDVLDQRYFETVDQTEAGCRSLPVIPAGQPIIIDGQCDPNIQVIKNFDAGAYLGTWHLIESYWSEFQVGDCVDATYNLLADGSVEVLNTQVINQTLDTMIGNAVLVPSNDGSGKLSVTFPDAPFPIEYWVIDTDYTSYALVYSCVNLPNNQQQIWSWKMSRTRSLSNTAIANINAAISNVWPLNAMYYYTINNSDQACFYFPVPDGKPVVFRGDCDESIPAVANFDAVAYMGQWYDIESYPQSFQEGSCSTAFYTLGDVVEVFNTQVVNQTLDTITGSAVVASTDGTAKLNVTFPIEVAPGIIVPVYSPYWVLATDYTDYALVYSCQNNPQGGRNVSSWKLSRSKTLSPQAQAAINNIIQGIDVLSDDYYEVKGHTDADCFYYPEPTGEPVVFRGQCSDNIQAFPNFDLQRFVGDWNEIETYPKDQVGGQCIKHTFSTTPTSNTTLLLTSNQVFNSENLVSNNGNIVLNSADGSGRFVLSINANNQNIVIPYWVIDTDYDNYALVYSCLNRDNETRAVYSWKLSRSTFLSNNASNAIASAIAAVDVLDQRYYEPVSQTDDSCFYLPETGPFETAIFPGQCDPNITVVPNFFATDYLGTWHLIETYHSDFQLGDCNDATYSLNLNGTVLVFNTEVINQRLDTITGLAEVVDNAKLSVTFPTAPFATDYWVLDTDYTSFALVYSCLNLPNNRQQVWSWKMSRTRSLTPEANQRINQKINEVRVLNQRYFKVVNNSDADCFYFPEPNPNESVTFRGQCDLSIPALANFDAVAYMGTWYDIERYPQVDQPGSCGTATYSLSDVVDVYNTQVINQTLDTINGTAIPVSTDGSAKLEVTFPIQVAPNVTIDAVSPYWVLATDYLNYALVYSCRNLENGGEYGNRSVASWKLSRTRAGLSAQAQTVINNVIQGIDVLNQDLYITPGHSDADCFYYPEPSGEPVVFPGQCDNSIQAVPNFDLQRFSGTWREIETYPKEQAGGQCINHEFSAVATSNNTLQLISNQVFNSETLVSNDGQLVLDSTDGSGRFSLTINVGNSSFTIPYWVITTDYENYALVYSCMNRDNDTRAVYSWKLSRSTSLSNVSNNAIANAISSVDVLDQRYYEPVSQTDDSCFYLPETGPFETAIFPGQCDPNITVTPNFNAADYLGKWYLVETYHSDFQIGDCNDATYSLNDDGSVLVFNTEVIDQRLDTITGNAVVVDNAKLSVTFPTAPVATDYWVLDTDYTTFSLVYSCVNLPNNRQQVWSWKMGRTRTLTPEANQRINQKINEVRVLNERYYRPVNNTEEACFYFPEPNGQPVRFRGRCDQSIPVVQNFDVASYLGTWYDIESYPEAFQIGTCATAEYSLGSEGVDVYNTQVIAQQLDVQTGVATVNSTDGSAKLAVNFIVDGVSFLAPYWVLATDYNSYSLVYSCTEIDYEFRSVTSWKLSRNRTLSAAANQQINQVIQNIQCPNPNDVQAVNNFNLNGFSGVWHEVSRFPSELQTGQCASGAFDLSTQNNFAITQNIVYNERLVVANGTGTPSADGRGVISTSLTGDQFAVNSNLYILDTDYTEFALVYACRNVNNNTQKQIYSWKLSRSRAGLSQAANNRINAIVSNNTDLFELYYEETAQTNDACFYYPEVQDNPNMIELPGPCNSNIRGVANFSAADYLGRWFEMYRYPQPWQFGACDQATYSLGDDAVDVYNTQVVYQQLLIQEGTAEVASTDGTGQLLVTFNVNNNGTINQANYYILATDYTSYSLVYSCRDLPNGNRQVSSWKLSRDRNLTNAANQAMDQVINATQGLRPDYYVPTSQSDEDCFYIPEPNPDAAVLFRGRCENITGITNFNVENFLGLWHEIERYPTGQDGDGVCLSSDFSSSGNQYQVVDKSVSGWTANFSTSTVTISNDGRITRSSGGNTADVWVLATDYTTYALLYSCENVDDEYRRVWSAKHSRTRTLPTASEFAIREAMASTQVLHDQLYVPVDQSEEACFYYPEVTGGPVVMPGQCDENIPVMQNFSFEEYSGNWYQIERYPQMWETGNCTGARYTVNENGTVDVLNWQVIDGVLDTIEGTAVPLFDDGSGRVQVFLPSRAPGAVEGDVVTTNLYVLRTDYVSYSLAYSCVNINAYQRQLGVWKLSRTKELPAAGAAEINAYINGRQELDQRYFVAVGQSDDCEEPSSGYLVQSSIILLLVCSILQLLK